MKKGMLKFVLAVLILLPVCANAISWETFDGLPINSIGISGSNLVTSQGIYNLNTRTYSPIIFPEARLTSTHGIDGTNIFGSYIDNFSNVTWHGFVFDGLNWVTFDKIDAEGTVICDMDGSNIIGYYVTSDIRHGFYYDSTSWTIIDLPPLNNIGYNLMGISGYNIVTTSGVYNLQTQIWTELSFPNATSTQICDIDGDIIVGNYTDFSGYTHGFLYNGGEWITLDYPGSLSTTIGGIDGTTLVGTYYYYESDQDYGYCGFVATIPEPISVLLFAGGALFVRRLSK